MTAKEALFNHWKWWWEKNPDSKNMDLEMGIFEENNEDLEWILPAMEEYAELKQLSRLPGPVTIDLTTNSE